jgi:hypothetical protein
LASISSRRAAEYSASSNRKDYAVSAEVYGVPALTANSLIDSASIWHRIEEDLLL